MILPTNYMDRMKLLLKDEWDAYDATFNMPYYQGLRINDLKVDAPSFKQMAPFSCELEEIPWVDNGFYFDSKLQPAKHPYYHGGLYYIQEPSAMLPAAVLPISKGDKVLDLCAAPGGKTTQLGARLNHEGLLVSNDISPSRAKAIVKNIELFGIRNSIILSESPKKLEKYFIGFFDKILVDAPCSGEGMFRKDPTMIKNWVKTGVEYYVNLQKEILPSAAVMLKSGGFMVYSTCTFSIEENEKVIKWFLDEHPDFSLKSLESMKGFKDGYEGHGETKRLWPHHIKGEGHFVALLQKRNANDSISHKPYQYDKINIKELKPYLEFEEEVLKEPINKSKLSIIKDKLYWLPDEAPDLKGLRVLKSGWYLGDFNKGRFEPSQAFANGLRISEVKKVINLSLNQPEVIKYLKGETLNIDVDDGYHLICVDGFPLGWAKKAGNILKNKYSPGWRWQ